MSGYHHILIQHIIPILLLCTVMTAVAQQDSSTIVMTDDRYPVRHSVSAGLVLGQHTGIVVGGVVWKHGMIEMFGGIADLPRKRHEYVEEETGLFPAPAIQISYAHCVLSVVKPWTGVHTWLAAGMMMYRFSEDMYRWGLVGGPMVDLEIRKTPLHFRVGFSVLVSFPLEFSFRDGLTMGILYRF